MKRFSAAVVIATIVGGMTEIVVATPANDRAIQGGATQQVQVGFDDKIVRPIAEAARVKAITSIFFIVGGSGFTSACHGDAEIIVNTAQDRVFPQFTQPATRERLQDVPQIPVVLCGLEVAQFFVDSFLSQSGIKGGLRDDTLYVIVNPKYAHTTNALELVYERWTADAKGGYLIAKATLPRRRDR